MAIDLRDPRQVRIVNSPDVRFWPETAAITQVTFDGASTRVEFTKHYGPDRWPDVRPAGWDGDVQYTLWLFRQIEGQWVGAGFIQFWHNREASGSPQDPDVPSVYHLHWFYGTRWDPIQRPGPIQPGEVIGFLVSSGNARDSAGPYGPQERSNLVTFAASDKAMYRFEAPSVGTPPPSPTPPPEPPAPPTPPEQPELPGIADLLIAIEQVIAAVQGARLDVQALKAEVAALKARVAPVYKGTSRGGITTLTPQEPPK